MGPRHGESEPNGPRAAVEVEDRGAAPGERAEPEGLAEQLMHACGLSAVGLDEGAEGGQVQRSADAIRQRSRSGHHDGLSAEDLRPVAFVEVDGHAGDRRCVPHEAPPDVPQGFERSDARALDDEGDQNTRLRAVVDLAQIERSQRAFPRRLEGGEKAAFHFGFREACPQQHSHHREHRRDDTAMRDVDDLVAAAFGKEADAPLRPDDELRARSIAHERLCGGDGLGVDELQGRVARHGLDDASSLEAELLSVGKRDDRATAAAVGVLARHALGFGRNDHSQGLRRCAHPRSGASLALDLRRARRRQRSTADRSEDGACREERAGDLGPMHRERIAVLVDRAASRRVRRRASLRRDEMASWNPSPNWPAASSTAEGNDGHDVRVFDAPPLADSGTCANGASLPSVNRNRTTAMRLEWMGRSWSVKSKWP